MTLHHGDCLAVMATLPDASVDAIVTDPPYGLGFMGKHWDHGAPGPDFWREILRVAKPGAHLLAFGGTRTVHRIATSIEDAGWEIRDMLVWAYASGFPKSLDVSKALDKRAGAERAITRPAARPLVPGEAISFDQRSSTERERRDDPVTAAAAAGWGTALKPAWEPIVMARKPLIGSVADNWLEHGTGALNIDGCRIGTDSTIRANHGGTGDPAQWRTGNGADFDSGSAAGRWPSNVILTDPIFDGGVDGVVGGGETHGGGLNHLLRRGASTGAGLGYGSSSPEDAAMVGYDDTGTYSRFFLIPKADRSDREPVLGGLELRLFGQSGGAAAAAARGEEYQGADASTGLNRVKRRANVHPTVKPTDLMRHLVRLVTPPGGIVLDPFLGSGTTAIACEMEGFAWIGIEKEAEYVAIAEARLNGVQKGLGLSA